MLAVELAAGTSVHLQFREVGQADTAQLFAQPRAVKPTAAAALAHG